MLSVNNKKDLNKRYLIYGSRISTEYLYKYQDLILKCKDGEKIYKLETKNIKPLFKLVKMGFIERKGNVYKTTIPIILGDDYKYIRKKSKVVADFIVKKIREDIKLLKNELYKLGYLKYTELILFSIIMDDLVFSIFERKDVSKHLSTLKENRNEYNQRYIWLSNIRKSTCGTYFVFFQKGEIRYIWDLKKPIPDPFPFDEEDFISLDIFQKKKLNQKKLDRLQKYGLITNQKVTIPLLYEDTNKKFFILCDRITKKIALSFMKKCDMKKIDKNLRINNIHKTVCIIYHEIMTDILEILEREQAIKKYRNINPLIFLYYKRFYN